VGEDPSEGQLAWKSIPGRARELGISARGHFGDQPGLPDAQAARRAIAYVLRRFDAVDAILLIRDMDDHEQRRDGLRQARANDKSGKRIVIGLAIVERECWVISGFDPTSDEEQTKLAEESRKLGFDPCLRSHELTACKDDQAKKSPKRVLKALTCGGWERQRQCWQSTGLTVLDNRGEANGLKDYFTEFRQQIVPLITGYTKRSDRP
jgi:hypothetical protein